MGRTKTFTNASLTRLFPEEDIPHAMAQGTVDYILNVPIRDATKVTIPEYATYYMEQALPQRLKRSYKWQQKKYKYPIRPAVLISRDLGSLNQTYIQYLQFQGKPVANIAYASFETPNFYHLAMVKAQRSGLYDPATGKFPGYTALTGTDVRLQEVLVDFSHHWVSMLLYTFHDSLRTDPREPKFTGDILALPEFRNSRVGVPGRPYRSALTGWDTATIRYDNNNALPIELRDGPTGGLPETTTAYIEAFFVAVDGQERDVEKNLAGTFYGPYRPVSASNVNIPQGATLVSTEVGTHITHMQVSGAVTTYTEQEGTKYVYQLLIPLSMEDYVSTGFRGLDPPLQYRLNVPAVSSYGTAPQTKIPEFLHLAWIDTSGGIHYEVHQADLSDVLFLQSLISNKGSVGKFPAVLPVQIDNENLLERPSSDPDIKMFKKYGNKVSIPWKPLTRNMRKAMDTDKDKVYNCFLGWYVPLNVQDQVSIRYLFEWFNQLYALADPMTQDPINLNNPFLKPEELARLQAMQGPGWKNGFTLNLGDGLIYKEFNFDAFKKTTYSGSKAEVGKYASEIDVSLKQAKFYHQQDANSYVEIIVQDPETKFDVTKNLNYATLHLEEFDNEEKSCACAPFDLGIFEVSKWKFRDRELLVCRSTYIVVTTFVKIKLKWYQTGLFKVVLAVVIAIVSYFFPPTSGLLGTLAGAISGAAVGTTAYAVAAAALSVIAMFLGQVIASKLTGKLGQIFQVIMIIYGVYQIGSAINAAGLVNAMRADILTFIGRAGDIYKRIMALQMSKLNDTYKRQLEEQKAKRKEDKKYSADEGRRTIQTTWETRGSHIDQGFLVIGESTDAMIARTLAVNTGLMPIDYISQTAETGIELPTLDDWINQRLRRTIYDGDDQS